MYTLKVQPIGCADGLDMGVKKRTEGMIPKFWPKQSKGQSFHELRGDSRRRRLKKGGDQVQFWTSSD